MIGIKIPKIELHVHLDGSVRISTLAELSGLSLEEAQLSSVASMYCKDLNEYLTKFNLPISVMQTRENLIRISAELAEDLKNDGVIYAEVRFAPHLHLKNGLSLDEVIDAVLVGLRSVDIKINLILSMMRNESSDSNIKIISLAKGYIGKGVVAIDLAGAEALYKTADFKELFSLARSLGIPYTIHAGEADDWSSVFSAIEFGAARIGHGVRAIENKHIVDLLKQKNILLEICPTSNIQTGIVKSISAHPINELYKMGVKISINTDNRTVSFIDLDKEYIKLSNSFKYDIKDFCLFNKMAIEASFLTKVDKEFLLNEIDEYLKQFS
jgi:adenosine deaminase